MRDQHEFLHRGAVMHGDDDLMDQLRGLGADAAGTEDLARLGLGDHFHKSVRFPHDHAFPMIIEGVAGGDKGDILSFQLHFTRTDNRHLRM